MFYIGNKNIQNNDEVLQASLNFLLLVLAINGLFGSLVYFFANELALYIREVFIVGFLLALIVVILFKENFIFQLRLIFLITIGYYAGLVKAIDVNLAFSPVEIGAQTVEVTLRMIGLTSISIFGGAIGFLIVGAGLSLMPPKYSGVVFEIKKANDIYILNAIIVIVVGYLSSRSYGQNVFEASYASGTGEGQSLGNLQSIGVVSLTLCAIASKEIKSRQYYYSTIFLAVYFLVWGIFIRGGRTEVLSGVIALFVCVPISFGNVVKLNARYCFIILLGIGFLEIWGGLRDVLSNGGASIDYIVGGYSEQADKGIYHAGTISGIATTFSNIVHMIDNGVVDYNYGGTYVDYILRTPPEFIYPDRPIDPAWMFQEHGYIAIGGFFELAEAYYNFGIFGCFFIPMLISVVIGASYKNALNGMFFWLIVYIAIVSVFPRGAWYQTFAFYKSIFTGLIMYFIIDALIKNGGEKRHVRK